MRLTGIRDRAADALRFDLSPARIAVIYAAFGLVALYVSDVLLARRLSGPALARVQALKGAVEVLLTAGLIYVLTTYSERQLQRTNRRLETFARVVSHDLRNPLATLEGSIELAEETGDPEDFDRCRRVIRRMRRLVEDLLTLARDGDIIDATAPVAVADVAESAWRTAETGDADLSVEADVVIEADRDRLEQLLWNLYRNAVEHGGPDVTVTVGGLADGFSVEDDGAGLPESRGRVFEAGYSTKSDGTGLGLDIVKRIARAHGWDVAAVEGRDGGARFEITGAETRDRGVR